MKKWIALCVVIIVAVITNPKKEDHVDAVKTKISQAALSEVAESASSGSDFEQAGAIIGMSLGVKVIDTMIESLLQVNNCLLFSLTKFSYAGKERIIGVGAFGNVWLFADLKEGLSGFEK
jgi:hypothetical protein